MRFTLILVIGLLLFFTKNNFAQMPSAEERSVQLNATVETSPPSIHLTWKEDAGASKYVVYRKTLEAETWGAPIANLSGTTTSFTDTDVAVGEGYEYAFFKEDFSPRIDTVCVPAGTEVNFTINDMYGIGLCCSFGFGSYEVTNCSTVQSTGADFGMSASSIFTTCDDGNSCSDVVIKIETDMFENSNSWVLTNNATGAIIATSGPVGSFLKPRPEYGFIYAGIELPPVENRGVIVLLLENSIVAPLADEIEELKLDYIKDGWQVLTRNVDANDSPQNVRSMIQDIYTAEEELKAVFILGHVPIAYSGNIFPDTHSEFRGAYPADVFYGEMDGTWTDNSVVNTSSFFDIYHNVMGDGKFDQSAIPTGEVELQVGRVDFFDMPAFGNSDIPLLRQYLEKNHAFKMREINPVRRALIDDNFMQSFAAPAASGYRNFSTMFGSENIFQQDYLTTLENESYLWSYGCGSGTITSSMGVGNTSDFVTSNLQSVFTMLFGSQFGNWAYPNNFLRAPLASGQTLTSVWAGSPPWTLHHMAMGHPIGYSTLKTQNGTNGLYLGNGPQLVHVALMGDPTLRMHMVAPPTNLVFNNTPTTIDLSWNAPTSEEIFGYHVYRADSLNGKYERINTAVETTNNFTDDNPNTGENWYMVRTLKLENSASGSYFNLSLGALDSISFSSSALLVAGFSTNLQEGCAPFTVKYNNTSTGNISNYLWTFEGGNPTTSTLQNPEVIYANEGTYDVTLNITDAAGMATEIKSEYILIKDVPTPAFNYSDNNGTVQFQNNSTNANSVMWDFGDGNTSIDFDAAHTFATTGIYTVTLYTTNDCGTMSVEQELNIVITSLENTVFGKNISVFPNPTDDVLNIDFGKKLELETQIELFNALGQKVFFQKINKNTMLEKVEFGAFPMGIYFLKIETGNVKTVKRIVLN